MERQKLRMERQELRNVAQALTPVEVSQEGDRETSELERFRNEVTILEGFSNEMAALMAKAFESLWSSPPPKFGEQVEIRNLENDGPFGDLHCRLQALASQADMNLACI